MDCSASSKRTNTKRNISQKPDTTTHHETVKAKTNIAKSKWSLSPQYKPNEKRKEERFTVPVTQSYQITTEKGGQQDQAKERIPIYRKIPFNSLELPRQLQFSKSQELTVYHVAKVLILLTEQNIKIYFK